MAAVKWPLGWMSLMSRDGISYFENLQFENNSLGGSDPRPKVGRTK